jgi:hypothetical protein
VEREQLEQARAARWPGPSTNLPLEDTVELARAGQFWLELFAGSARATLSRLVSS